VELDREDALETKYTTDGLAYLALGIDYHVYDESKGG